jgi:hypothetical protein
MRYIQTFKFRIFENKDISSMSVYTNANIYADMFIYVYIYGEMREKERD